MNIGIFSIVAVDSYKLHLHAIGTKGKNDKEAPNEFFHKLVAQIIFLKSAKPRIGSSKVERRRKEAFPFFNVSMSLPQ